ncbi:MAG: hypothetical protein LBR90_03565 [Elusimicrobiota bacterium]|nr:hypothetical protein [Elusimicrobiota bacterium]
MKKLPLFLIALCLTLPAVAAAPPLLFKKTAPSKQAALEAYLFNMHLVYPAEIPPRLDKDNLPLEAAGAAQALQQYNIKTDFAALYAAKREEIQTNLQAALKNAAAPYSHCESKDLAFINMLLKSKQSGYYFYSGPPPQSKPPAHEVNAAVKAALSKTLKELKKKAALLPAHANAFDTNFYMNAAQDCGSSAHYICSALLQAQNAYAGWDTAAVYRLTVLPPQGKRYLITARGDEKFLSPRGGGYFPWQYHRAALLILQSGSRLAYIVADPPLLAKPASFEKWFALFDPASKFLLEAFTDKTPPEEGKVIIPKKNLPRGSLFINPFLE